MTTATVVRCYSVDLTSLNVALESGGQASRVSQAPKGRAQNIEEGLWGEPSDPDVRTAVTPWVPKLMSQCWTKGLLPEVHQKVGVQLEPSIYSVYINLQHHGAFPGRGGKGER